MLTRVARLAPLEIEPGRSLPGTVVTMRTEVDPGGLAVTIPALNLNTTCGHLRFVARAIRAYQVYRGTGPVARHQVTTVAGIFGGRHDGARYTQALPAKALKDRR